MRVSRKIKNDLRRERRANPTVQMLSARRDAESAEKRTVREQAEALHAELATKGATWSACVQAVKTGWVSNLKAKYQ